MAKLEDVMPEFRGIKDDISTPGKENKKQTGKKRRAWIDNDSSNNNITNNKRANNSIDMLNQLSNSQKSSSNKGTVQNEKKELQHKRSINIEDLDRIHSISPFKIKRWSEKDRPQNELGNIEDLANSFKLIGQQVPCIVRPINSNNYEFELIVGECRWEAAKTANTSLKVIIRDIDDRMACLVQAVENEKRSNLSEFARGMSYANKIAKGFLSQKDLVEILGISQQQVSRLLSFKKIPKELLDAIGDFRLVSARTAEELSRLSRKGREHIEILINISSKIKSGKCGHNTINKIINRHLSQHCSDKKMNTKIYAPDGRHLFTWRLDNNSVHSIHFPNDIIKLIESEKLNFDDLNMELRQWLTKKLINLND